MCPHRMCGSMGLREIALPITVWGRWKIWPYPYPGQHGRVGTKGMRAGELTSLLAHWGTWEIRPELCLGSIVELVLVKWMVESQTEGLKVGELALSLSGAVLENCSYWHVLGRAGMIT